MGDQNDDEVPPIAENPSSKELSDLLSLVEFLVKADGFLEGLGVPRGKLADIASSAKDVLEQAKVLELPDKFNKAFGDGGWILTGSFSATVAAEAIALYEEGKLLEAEQVLVDWFTEDHIRLFAITRSKTHSKSLKRWDQLQEALMLTLEERYMAAVPLILIAADGFASDVLGKSPFEKDADLSVFDSIVGHPTGLPKLIGMLTKGVRKSSDDELGLPLRHGILHGRSLGYDNKIVCMKAWLLFIALVDWAVDKRDEDSRIEKREEKENESWDDTLRQMRKTQADKKEIDEFEPRRNTGPFDIEFDVGSPEFAFSEFLIGWRDKNYGRMAKHVTNLFNESDNKIAGDLRRDTELIQLEEFVIRSVEHEGVVRAVAYVKLTGRSLNQELRGNHRIVAIRYTPDGEIAMPTDHGRWYIQQRCIYDFLHGKVGEE